MKSSDVGSTPAQSEPDAPTPDNSEPDGDEQRLDTEYDGLGHSEDTGDSDLH